MEIKCITSVAHKLDLVDYMLEHIREDGFMCYSVCFWLEEREYFCMGNTLDALEESLRKDNICISDRYTEKGVSKCFDSSIVVFSALLPEILKYKPSILHNLGGWFDVNDFNSRYSILTKVKEELIKANNANFA